jgi:tetratricopeptide (TPR) repeat protein
MQLPFRFPTAICAVFAVAALSPARPLAAQGVVKDTLVKRSGERLRAVELIELGSETVKYRKAGAEATMPAVQLAHVEWTDPPDAFDLGRGALDKGDSEAAANFFQEAATKASDANRKVLATECRFQAARALALGMGNDTNRASAAKTALQAFIDGAAGNFRLLEARLLHARALRVGGDAAGAEAALKAFEDDALKQGWGLGWDARAKLERAQLLLAQNKAAEARTAFQGVRSAVDAALGTAQGNDAKDLEALKMLAVVNEGETYVREAKLDEAKKYFAQLASTSRSDPVRAAALAGEAHAVVLSTGGKPEVKPLRDAQQKLAEAILLDTDNGDTTAKAMVLQGKILTTLGPQHEADNFKQRARDYFETVVKYYGSSPWASEARVEMTK